MGTHPIFESDFDCLTDFKMNESTLMNNLALHGMYTSTTGTTSTAQVRPSSAQSGATQNSTQSTQRQFHHHHFQQSLIRPGQQQQQHHNQHRHQSSATLRIHGQNPKNVLMWTVDDVVVWLGQCCSVELQSRYAQTIRYHDINGRALMRMDDEKLQLLGIENATHRYEILKEIYKQQLRNHEKYFKELNQSLSGRQGISQSNNSSDQFPPMFARSGGVEEEE